MGWVCYACGGKDVNINIQSMSLEYFTARLKRREPFAFVRYGDGEFQAILGVKGQNCDGHEYFLDLGVALAKTLRHPRMGDYLYAIGPKAARGMQARVGTWLEEYASEITWHDTEVFLRASLLGELYPLVNVLNHRRVVVVGPAHLTHLWENRYLREPDCHIVTPDVNAWLEKKRIAQDILRAANPTNPNRTTDVILFSAGMVSKILIWEMYPVLKTHTSLLDTGSLFDLYCGRDSRSYARRLSVEKKAELTRMNFGLNEFFKVSEVTNA